MTSLLLTTTAKRRRTLIAMKVLHTVVWAFFVGCIFAIPVAGLMRRFVAAWILTGVVLVEYVAKSLAEKPDEVVVEAPTYIGTVQTFELARARLIGVPVDADGIRTDALEDVLARN